MFDCGTHSIRYMIGPHVRPVLTDHPPSRDELDKKCWRAKDPFDDVVMKKAVKKAPVKGGFVML